MSNCGCENNNEKGKGKCECVGSLVTKTVPNFVAPAVMPNNTIDEYFNLRAYLNGAYGVVFFYPLDFTFVCPSEILAHNNRIKDFEAKGVKVVGVSVDSHFTHLAWKNTPVKKGGIGELGFPLVADLDKSIGKNFGVMLEAGIALRGTFLIDKDGIVRHQVVNDLPLGRNVDELLRMVDALQFTEEFGEVCPAGWNKGDEGMKASTEGVAEYLGKHEKEL